MPAKKKTYQKENLEGVMTRAARRMKSMSNKMTEEKAYEEAKVSLSPSARSPTPSGDFTTPLSSPIRTEDEKAKKAQQHPGPRVMSNKQIIFSVSVALLAIVAFQVGRSDWGQEKVRIMQNAWEDQRVQWLEENPTLDAIVKMFSKKAESLDLAKMWNELTWENVKEKMTWTEVKEAISASSFEIKREEYKIASWFNAVKAAWYEEDDQQED